MDANTRLTSIVRALGVLSVLTSGPTAAVAAPFTLTREALMLLDYASPQGATVSGQTLTPTGVLFDIQYSSNTRPGSGLYYWSSAANGAGSLAGMDVSAYDGFGLRFTLVSVDSQTAPPVAGPLIIGSLIDGKSTTYRYRPEVIGLDGVRSASAVSLTTGIPPDVEQIGFVANIPYWWWTSEQNPWPSAGAQVQLLVEPMAGAAALPEPGTTGLLVPGTVVALGRRRRD